MLKKIYNKGVAYELRKLGERILFTEPNYKNILLDVYVFEYTDTIEDNLTVAMKKHTIFKQR